MDLWPAWVRWSALFAVYILLFGLNRVAIDVTSNRTIGLGLVWFLWSILAVWCGVSIAPRYKMPVAFVFALFPLYMAKYYFADYELTKHDFMLLTQDERVQAMAETMTWGLACLTGVIVALGLILWGYLRRRQAGLSSR